MGEMIKSNNLPAPLRNSGIREKLEAICRENDVVFLAIFGSYVRRRHGKAGDIDIAIEFDKNKNRDLLDLIRLERELGRMFKKKVDLGTFSSISPYVINDVKKEMKVVYEKR
jgi:predicted nucleotidyltransferase